MAVTGGDNRNPEPAPNTHKSSPNPDQTPQSSSSPESFEDHANQEGTTPEQQEAREEGDPSTPLDFTL
jgi:hypothetical protein